VEERHAAQRTEIIVSAENWHEERDRLVELLKGIESGKITHIDEDDLRELQATSPENIAVLKKRLAQLNARLGDDKP
jgi:predicted nucleotidyltransferase